MARGEIRPNGAGRVDRASFMLMGADMEYFQNRAQDNDNAPAGGIKRPEMESCTNCGTETPKGSGSCADCK